MRRKFVAGKGVAMVWGAAILLVAAVPVGILINAQTSRRSA